MKTYTAAVIGAGSIGALKPDKYDSPKSKNILTHCHALHVHPQIDLVAIIDTDIDKAKQAAGKWNTKWYELYYDQVQTLWPDIVIIATPTETHHKILLQTPHYNPKLVICEKPFTDNIRQAKEVIDAYKAANIPLMVNYTRRFDPAVQTVKEMIEQEKVGKAQNCRIVYNRGLRRDGSHAIDLLNYFFGECAGGHLEQPGYSFNDYSKEDPTYAVYLGYERCPHVALSPTDGRHYSIFEVDILMEKARFTFVDHGLRCNTYPLKDSVYGDYKDLCYKLIATRETGLNVALYNLVENAVDYLEKRTKKLFCTGNDALKVHEVYDLLGV